MYDMVAVPVIADMADDNKGKRKPSPSRKLKYKPMILESFI